MAKRFVGGQRITKFPGSTVNELADRLTHLERLVGQPLPPRRPQGDRLFLVVPVKNTLATPLVERSIMGVKESAFTPPDITVPGGGQPDQNEATAAVLVGAPVEIEAPDETKHGGRFVITLAPIAALGTGWAAMIGLVWARVDLTDAAHKFATLKTGDQQYLKSAGAGLSIWSRKKQDEPGDATKGKQWALVLLGGGGGGEETNRLIRGLSVGPQNGPTILIDNIVKLAGGLDPSGDDPLFQLRVRNFGQTFADAEAVQAIYSPGSSLIPPADWEVVKITATPDSEDIRGYAYTAISAASGIRGQNLTPGTGLAQLYLKPASGAAGTAWTLDPAGPVTAENWMRGSVAVGKPILLRKSRLEAGLQIYLVVAEGCAAIPDSPGGQS